MQVFKTLEDFENYRNQIPETQSIGFVPTMGALHEGHLSLFQKAIKDNSLSIGSIFVNPTQFDNKDDLAKYPNQLESDIQLLEQIGVSALFAPSIEEVYPDGPKVEDIDLHGLDQLMEGAYRPGHFQGMATVVKRLLEIVRPDKAYFGEKDYQQLQIIRNMVKDFELPVEIVGMPIIREDNGLAMSSRNMRLTDAEKEEASIIYKSLQQLKEKAQFGIKAQELLNDVYKNFAFSPLKLEYCDITVADTLKSEEVLREGKKYRAFIAAYCGEVRLIDNAEIL